MLLLLWDCAEPAYAVPCSDMLAGRLSSLVHQGWYKLASRGRAVNAETSLALKLSCPSPLPHLLSAARHLRQLQPSNTFA